MESKIKRIEELKSEASTIKSYILSISNKLPIQVDIVNILTELDEHLASGDLEKEKLEEYSFGLFRLTTENYTLEKSDLGKQLLNLQKNARSFIRDFYEAL